MKCGCWKCLEEEKSEDGTPLIVTFMVLCSICGNKRCPHASDHNLACTNSNEPEQEGSIYETPKTKWE
jgi:hypothetical protein